MSYRGPERRMHADDHDTVITMLQILDNHVRNFNMLKDDYDRHKDNNEKDFRLVFKFTYIGLGIIIAFNAIPGLVNTIKAVINIVSGGH